MGTPITLDISKIRIDAKMQSRVSINDDVVTEYTQAIKAGDEFPPVDVFYDGKVCWLADGFHRYYAHAKAGKKSVAIKSHQGSEREALLFSLGANGAHGLRRTNDDKRKAVETLLGDAEWSKWSDGEIARRCAVSQAFVSKLRRGASQNGFEIDPSGAPKTAIRGGKPYSVKTENIGKKAPEKPAAPPVGGKQAEPPTAPEEEAAGLAETIMEESPVEGMPQSPPEPPKAAVKDLDGNEIQQENIRSIFTRRGDMQKHVSSLTQIKSAITKALREGDALYGNFDESGFVSALDAARFAITSAMPHGICPACGGESIGKRCKACGGTGWMGKVKYEHAKKQMESA